MPGERAARKGDGVRIVIVAPAKAGNVWLKCILASIYELRPLALAELPAGATPDAFDAWAAGGGFPDGTIFHRHYAFGERFADAAAAVPAHLVTIVRDPYDVFVSLYFHMQNQGARHAARREPQAVMIGKPIDHPDVLGFLAHRFRSNLVKADEWLHGGRSAVVRYEALHREPIAAVGALTDRIRPVAPERIERALAECSAERMRQPERGMVSHVRLAKVGDSRERLSEAHLAIFRERYADLIRRLGYEVR